MPQKDLVSRIWTDVTSLLMPLLAMAAYVLGWSPTLRTVLTILCFAGIYGTWIVGERGRWRRGWRAERIARRRAHARRRRAAG